MRHSYVMFYQTVSFYFQVGICLVVLSYHFARTKYTYIFSLVQSSLVKTFVFFMSLHTYKKEKVSCIAVFQISF